MYNWTLCCVKSYEMNGNSIQPSSIPTKKKANSRSTNIYDSRFKVVPWSVFSYAYVYIAMFTPSKFTGILMKANSDWKLRCVVYFSYCLDWLSYLKDFFSMFSLHDKFSERFHNRQERFSPVDGSPSGVVGGINCIHISIDMYW